VQPLIVVSRVERMFKISTQFDALRSYFKYTLAMFVFHKYKDTPHEANIFTVTCDYPIVQKSKRWSSRCK
jgi:flagellar biosynthesis protein FlhB